METLRVKKFPLCPKGNPPHGEHGPPYGPVRASAMTFDATSKQTAMIVFSPFMFLLHEIKVVLPEDEPSIDRVPCHISDQTDLSVTGGEEIFFGAWPFFEVIAGRSLEHGTRGFFRILGMRISVDWI